MISKISSQLVAGAAPKSENVKPRSASGGEVNSTKNERQSRVERIAAQIADGSYKLDMSKTAKAVLDSLI